MKKRKKIKPKKPNIRRHMLDEVKDAKYLGVITIDDLSKKNHIDETSTKANNSSLPEEKIGRASRLVKGKLYTTLARPVMKCAKVAATKLNKVQ